MKWKGITADYIAKIDDVMGNFNTATFEDVMGDEVLRSKVDSRNTMPSRKARDNANARLKEIVSDEIGGILQTTNHYFADTLVATREDRVIRRLS